MAGCYGSLGCFACVLAFYGWWLDAVAERDSHQAFFEWAVKEVDANNQGAAALVLIEDGVVVQRFFKGDVGEDTLFLTASFSKWVAALTVMSLVEQNRIDLDAPVSRYLTRWQLPNSGV